MLNRSRNVVHHLLRLALPQQAVIDENAGQLLADRLMDQHRGDRANPRRPTARKSPARRQPAPRMRAISRAAERRHRPRPRQPATSWVKLRNKLRAMRRMHHLRMELHAVEPPRIVGDGGERRALADADHPEPRRQRGSPGRHGSSRPARARPCSRRLRTARNHPVTSTIGTAELAMVGGLHSPPSCAHSTCSP